MIVSNACDRTLPSSSSCRAGPGAEVGGILGFHAAFHHLLSSAAPWQDGDFSHLGSRFPLYDLYFAVQRTRPLQDALWRLLGPWEQLGSSLVSKTGRFLEALLILIALLIFTFIPKRGLALNGCRIGQKLSPLGELLSALCKVTHCHLRSLTIWLWARCPYSTPHCRHFGVNE